MGVAVEFLHQEIQAKACRFPTLEGLARLNESDEEGQAERCETGFELSSGPDAKIAIPKKALFDLLYLAPGKSRLFVKPPELSVPSGFQWRRLKEYTALVKSPGRRTYIGQRIEQIRSTAAKF